MRSTGGRRARQFSWVVSQTPFIESVMFALSCLLPDVQVFMHHEVHQNSQTSGLNEWLHEPGELKGNATSVGIDKCVG